MKDIHTLVNWKQVKAMGDPLRIRILDAFKSDPRTTKQVAGLLGEPPTKLYHHVDLLERAGLIRLESTRQNRGTIEKYYRAVAQDFIVDRRLLELRGRRRALAGYESLLLSALEATLLEARKAIAAHLIRPVKKGRNALVYRFHFRGSTAVLQKRLKIVRNWIEECRTFDHGIEGPEYGIAIALYPVKKRKEAK